MWYREGTFSVSSGSRTVTGIGTRWANASNGVLPGMVLLLPDFSLYEIKQVITDTELLLVEPLKGETVNNSPCRIITTYEGDISQFSARFAAMLSEMRKSIGIWTDWALGDGTVEITAVDGTVYEVDSLLKTKQDQAVREEWFDHSMAVIEEAAGNAAKAEAAAKEAKDAGANIEAARIAAEAAASEATASASSASTSRTIAEESASTAVSKASDAAASAEAAAAAVATAIATLGEGLIGVQHFTQSGTYTATEGTRWIIVEMQGAGGGGGAGGTDNVRYMGVGFGGSSGAYLKVEITKTAFSGVKSFTLTVGAGGAGGVAGGFTRLNFAGLSVGGGPAGGSAALTEAPGIPSARSITPATIYVNEVEGINILAQHTGEPGGVPMTFNRAGAISGQGGRSAVGPGGAGIIVAAFGASVPGGDAPALGAGGSGGASIGSTVRTAGGAGGGGFVTIWEYK